MAVAKMLKVIVFGHDSVLDDVVDRLQRAGVIQVEEVDPEEMEEFGLKTLSPDYPRINALDERIAKAQFLRDFLSRFREPDVAFGAFISEKVHLTEDEYLALDFDDEMPAVYRECMHISDRLGYIEREVARLEEIIVKLRPWKDLHLEISKWRGTEHVALFTGIVPITAAEQIRQLLRETCDEVSVDEVGDDGYHQAWVVMAVKDCLDEVRAALDMTDFAEVGFEGLHGLPADELATAEKRVEDLLEEKDGLVSDAEDLAEKHYKKTFALVQALLSRRDKLDVRDNFNATERAFLLTGWVCARSKDELVEALEESGTDIDVTFEEPGPDDKVPVELVNLPFLRPFEVLTDLYGRPKYGDIDPTPLMALSFSLFFGICVGDAGYGLLLLLVSLFIKYKLDVAEGVKQFLDLIMIGSVASIIVGVATRSYFALPPEALPSLLRYEPLVVLPDQILLYLILSLGLGVVHLLFGMGIGFYQHARHGEWKPILSETIPLLLVFAALGVLIAAPSNSGVALGLVIFAILLQGRIVEVRSLTSALLVLPIGIIGVFNGTLGFVGDTLSYARLAALGLASFLVGDVINRLAGMTLGAGVAGVVFAAALFLVGQGINTVLSLLGAFVHPARLHLVEFFSKFYEGGGKKFAPFAVRRKSLILHPATDAGAKGGGKCKK